MSKRPAYKNLYQDTLKKLNKLQEVIANKPFEEDAELKSAKLEKIRQETLKFKLEQKKLNNEIDQNKKSKFLKWLIIIGQILAGTAILAFYINYILKPAFETDRINNELEAAIRNKDLYIKEQRLDSLEWALAHKENAMDSIQTKLLERSELLKKGNTKLLETIEELSQLERSYFVLDSKHKKYISELESIQKTAAIVHQDLKLNQQSNRSKEDIALVKLCPTALMYAILKFEGECRFHIETGERFPPNYTDYTFDRIYLKPKSNKFKMVFKGKSTLLSLKEYFEYFKNLRPPIKTKLDYTFPESDLINKIHVVQEVSKSMLILKASYTTNIYQVAIREEGKYRYPADKILENRKMELTFLATRLGGTWEFGLTEAIITVN